MAAGGVGCALVLSKLKKILKLDRKVEDQTWLGCELLY